MKRKMILNKIMSVLIIATMFSAMLVPLTVAAVVPDALETGAYNTLYTAADGNIARNATALAVRVNASTAGSINNGALATTASNTLNTWGGAGIGTEANPAWVMYNWDNPQMIEAMRVMWHIYTDSGVRWPTSCKLQYLPDGQTGSASTPESAWVDVPGNAVVGVDGNSASRLEGGVPVNRPALPITSWGRNTAWNILRLETPVVAKCVRLRIVSKTASESTNNTGIGVSEWEVFGEQNDAAADLVALDANFLKNLTDNVVLPTAGAAGSTIVWSESTNTALGIDGTVTRPAIDEPNAEGKITATATKGTSTYTLVFDFSVLALKSDVATVADDLAAIDLGITENRTTNFTFPTAGQFGSDITWDTKNSSSLWADGTVIRPPAGQPDASITVTATATYGTKSDTRAWEVTIPAHPGAGRSIVSYEAINVDCPQGTAPKLPNLVKVTYSDGETELRKIQWGGNTVANQTTQAGYAVDHTYTLNGNIIGDNSTTNGFVVTANITVVAGTAAVPSNEPVAETLPLHDVVLDNDPNGDINRLTLNRDGHIRYMLSIPVTSQLYNYRQTFGESVTGYTSPTGWDSPTTKLKGHGHGHYMSGLAMAYSSGATAEQKTQLMDRMKRMTDELRELQEKTFVQHATEDRYVEARDRYSTAAQVSAMTNVRVSVGSATAPATPEVFGHGYINAIQPEHLILIENYAPYNGTMADYGVWAPYYSLHKQIAGLVDIFYALDGGSDDEQEVADKALVIAKDMGMWVWNRLYHCTQEGIRPNSSSPGYRDSMWGLYIAGEYGGMNETLARLADITKKQGDAEDSAKLLECSEFFDNNGSSSDSGGIPYFSSLANNRDSVRTLHANQHIPQIIGAIWNFKVGADAKYYNIAENFWDYVVGRYSYTIGGVGGRTTNSEQFVGAYNQLSRATLPDNQSSCETCAAYNMLKLTKDLNAHNPDDAKYMDYYERLFYNQMVGSIVPGSSTNQTSYGYAITLNSTRSRGPSAQPGATCCSGTGTENHVKYQEATYFTSADKKAFYVGLYLPSTAKWVAQDATIKQSCVFPSQESTFKVTPGAGTTQFEMKFRVPYWVTEDFDIKLNGVSLAASYEPSSYVSTGVRTWAATDTVVVTMPFDFNVDYLPGKHNTEWFGNLMNGPLVMAATGVTAQSRIELDSYMTSGEGTNVTVNAPSTMTGGADGGRATNNVPSYSVAVTPGQTGGTTATRTFAPHYFVGSPAYTTYFYIPAPDESIGIDKTPLYNKMVEAKDRIAIGKYTAASAAALEAVLTTSAAVYQNPDTTEAQMDTAIAGIQTAIDNLEAMTTDIAELKAKLAEVATTPAKDYTPGSYANLVSKIAAATAYAEGDAAEYTDAKTVEHIFALESAVKALVLLDKSALEEALGAAAALTNPLNTTPLWSEHEFVTYTRKSWNSFKEIEAAAKRVNGNDPQIPTQSKIDETVIALNSSRLALLPFHLCDEREPLVAAIAAAKEHSSEEYTEESFAALQAQIEIAEGEGGLNYASLTFAERDGLIEGLESLAGKTIVNETAEAVEVALEAAREADVAAQAAEAAQGATEAAAVEAEAEAAKAVTEADKAAGAADKAKADADKAKADADKILAEAGESETVKLLAEAAQVAAVEAQAKAEAAQAIAGGAQEAAATAQTEAEAARAAAQEAAEAAGEAQAAAATVQDDALAAKEAAEAAKDRAETAKDAAEAAQGLAEAAQGLAEAAVLETQAAVLVAVAAGDLAKVAQAETSLAKAEVNVAKTEATAEAAEKHSEEAKKANEEAQKALVEAAEKKAAAEAAQVLAEKAQAAAETAQKVADDTLKAAEKAQAAAEKAQVAAEKAQASAEVALKKVEAGQTPANKVNKKDADAAALAKRKTTISSAKNVKKNKVKVTWKKEAAAVKYQVQYSLKKNFKGTTVAKGKPVTKTTSKTTYTISKLKNKKTYYVRVRAYTTNSQGKKVYGKWSTAKKVTVKK